MGVLVDEMVVEGIEEEPDRRAPTPEGEPDMRSFA